MTDTPPNDPRASDEAEDLDYGLHGPVPRQTFTSDEILLTIGLCLAVMVGAGAVMLAKWIDGTFF